MNRDEGGDHRPRYANHVRLHSRLPEDIAEQTVDRAEAGDDLVGFCRLDDLPWLTLGARDFPQADYPR